MEFLTNESRQRDHGEIILNFLSLLDGLTINTAEDILKTVLVKIKDSKIKVEETELTPPSHAMQYFMVKGKDFNHDKQGESLVSNQDTHDSK